jgi:hypothetical protein
MALGISAGATMQCDTPTMLDISSGARYFILIISYLLLTLFKFYTCTSSTTLTTSRYHL